MDYEKLYKEALERARNLHNDAISMGENLRAKQCEIIFPELKESEDEKIRKDIINFVKSRIAGFPECERFVTWLEKQGEQKPKRVGIKETTGTLKEMLNNIDPIELEETRKTMEEIDGFDAELNALLKKYEYLPKEELAECLEFYLGVVKNIKI